MMKTGTRRCGGVGVYLLTSCAVFVLLLLRQYRELAQVPIVWEDGTLFLSDALSGSFWRNISTPYVGYLHFLPRCIAEGAELLNLHYVPLYFRLASVAVAALALSFPVSPLFRTLLPRSAGFILVLLTVLMPWPTETQGNIASVHWYLFYFLMLLSLADTRYVSRIGVAIVLMVCALTVFSSPLCVLSIPIFLWRLLCRDKTVKERLIDTVVLGQIVVMLILVKLVLHAEGTPAGIEEHTASIQNILLFMVKAVGYKVIIITTAGQYLGTRFLQNWTALYTACLLFGLACLGLRMMPRKTEKGEEAGNSLSIPVMLYYILAPLVFTAVLRPHYVIHFVSNDLYFGASRYFYLSACVFFLLGIEFIRRLAYRFPRWRLPIVLLPLCWFAAIIPFNYLYPVTPDYGWRQKITDYYAGSSSAEHIVDNRYLIILPHDPSWSIFLPLPPEK